MADARDLSRYRDRSFTKVLSINTPITFSGPEWRRTVEEMCRVTEHEALFTVANFLSCLAALIDVSLGDNARAGLLLDANDASVGGLRIENVTASASGSGYGAVTQRTPVPDGWDTGIARMGAAATNDAAFSTPIDVVGIMMPPGLVATPPPF